MVYKLVLIKYFLCLENLYGQLCLMGDRWLLLIEKERDKMEEGKKN